MIFDSLNNFANYARLAPGTWAKLAAFLHGCTAETPAGRYEIDGDRLYAMVQSYNLHPVRPEKLEIHRNYVDIQLLLAGRETIVYRPVDGLPVTAEYDAVRCGPRHRLLPPRRERFGGTSARTGQLCAVLPGRGTPARQRKPGRFGGQGGGED